MPDPLEKRIDLNEAEMRRLANAWRDFRIAAAKCELTATFTIARTAYAALKEIESTEHTCCTQTHCDCQMIAGGALDEIRATEEGDGANSR